MQHPTRFSFVHFFSWLAIGAFVALPMAVSAETEATHAHQTGMTHQTPEWAEKLKAQTIIEDTKEGRPERSFQVDMQHQRIMRQMEQDAQVQHTNGAYNDMSMMHQYGAGGQDMLLVSDPRQEPVMQGGRCPAGAPVRTYDISAINVEITLNRFGDFFPGYMYALTENLEAVRAEEVKNKEARESEDETFSKGGVSNGLQGDLIQPLVIRANQGDCLRITLRNNIDGEPTNMIINGSDAGKSNR